MIIIIIIAKMNAELVVEEIVTKFLLNTCRLRPQLTRPALLAAMRCAHIAAQHLPNDAEAEGIPLTTGSVAEFYIEPMLPHVGDVDVMYHMSHQLAIPRGHPPPTQLPDEFHSCVEVYEIIDSHFSGYAYLVSRYLLTESVDDRRYNAVLDYDSRRLYLTMGIFSHRYRPVLHGPAAVTTLPRDCSIILPDLSCDMVPCVRCLVWPLQAADWPTRHRSYGWPDSTTVDRVVNNGCDMVHVAHRQCRQDEWMDRNQWRLSFSRAEIVLINSWMPVQQIVYHMLRVFMKTERFTDSANNTSSLSNYHIKTLMFWACELKSRNWWIDDLNLVRICVQLLYILGDWLTDARCQHYFINNCNLIENSFNVTDIGSQLMSIDATWLSTWFVDNYIRKCSQLSIPRSSLLDDVSNTTKLYEAVSAAVASRQNNSLLLSWSAYELALQFVPLVVDVYSLTARSCAYWMTELEKIDSHLSVYFTAVAFLHVAHRSSTRGLSEELMDVLMTVFGQAARRRHHSNDHASVVLLDKAAKLMKVVANISLSTMSLIAIELSKAYLHRALGCKDSDSDSVYCLANVYLAVLYYTTGQYQTASDHCTLVTRLQRHSQCSSNVVQGELLPKIDENVDSVLGLAVFYQHVQAAALNHQCPAQYVNNFTTEFFAHYIHVKFLSRTSCRQSTQEISTDDFTRYETCMNDTEQLFIGDVLLFVSLSRALKQTFYRKPILQPSHQPSKNTNENVASHLAVLLQKSAIEHLTTFRQFEAEYFGSVVTIVTTDFEALYAYQRGDYQKCLQLSSQKLYMLLSANRWTGVFTYPEFIQLLDDNIVSLTALTLFVDPECRGVSVYAHVTQVTLSLYLMTLCQLKLRHSVTSLAKTLDYIEVARKRHKAERILDHLTLKLIERKTLSHISTSV